MIVLGCNGFSRVSEFFSERLGATGINKHYLLGHDAAAALLIDGRLVAAVEEERLNREKKTTDFPAKAIDWCLEEAGITFDDVDLFAFPWNWTGQVHSERRKPSARVIRPRVLPIMSDQMMCWPNRTRASELSVFTWLLPAGVRRTWRRRRPPG